MRYLRRPSLNSARLRLVFSIAFGLAIISSAGEAITGAPSLILAQNPPPPSSSPVASPSPSASAAPATAGQQPSPTPGASPATNNDDQQPAVQRSEHADGGDASNIVSVKNHTDNRLRIRGSIQLNHIPGPNVQPVNEADAYSSCSGCQTISVALQIDLISRTASQIAPVNQAVALNYQCNQCTTVARALQYVVQVDDPTSVPDNVSDLVQTMDREIHAIDSDHGLTLTDAESRINAVISQFTNLAQSLYDQRSEDTQPTSPGAAAASS